MTRALKTNFNVFKGVSSDTDYLITMRDTPPYNNLKIMADNCAIDANGDLLVQIKLRTIPTEAVRIRPASKVLKYMKVYWTELK